MSNKHWTGEVPSASGDFIMWVDANLGALKTDAAIQRELTYTFAPQGAEFIASAKMKYVHTGVFDKFTSRYRTYARVYVPDGAVVKEVTLFEKNGKKTVLTPTIDQGKELGKQWFGVFVSVEPKETKELEFSYSLPQTITDQIKAGIYTVRAQKQAGLEGAALTLNLNFGTNIQSASPAEEQKNWGNASYTFSSEFKTDKEFSVSLK